MFKLPEWKYLKYNIQQKWADMTASKGYSSKSYKGDSFLQRLTAFRILLSTNPALKISAGLLCAILIIATLRISLSSGPKEQITDSKNLWFYDLNTGELFTAEKTKFPPIETESGPLPGGEAAGVTAHVFTYDPTGEDKSQQFIGYLEKLTEKGKLSWQDALETDSLAQMQWETGRLLKRVKDKVWIKADSPQGKQIQIQAYKPNKKGHIPQYVYPE